MEMCAKIDEIDEMCRPLAEISRQGDDAGTQAFFQSWVAMGDRPAELAAEDKARGRMLSAGNKLGRSATYYLTAERMQAYNYEPRKAL